MMDYGDKHFAWYNQMQKDPDLKDLTDKIAEYEDEYFSDLTLVGEATSPCRTYKYQNLSCRNAIVKHLLRFIKCIRLIAANSMVF